MSKITYPYYIPLFWRCGQMIKMYTSKKFSTFEEAKTAAFHYLRNPFLAKNIRQMYVASYESPYVSTLTEI